MDTVLGKAIKRELEQRYNGVESEDNQNCNYDRFVFTNCKNIKPKEICIKTNPRSLDWQVGFFNADYEVYFDKIEIRSSACFSSIVRNYWQNGKEGEEKKEGYYSLIKSVKELVIRKQHINDLFDYVQGRYEASEHWQIHKLDRNIKLRIYGEVEQITVERVQKYFDNIHCDWIAADLKVVNSITCNCECYLFRNCKGVVPQKLVINATVEKIDFYSGIINEIHIPEVVMEEKADLKSIVQNYCGGNEYYSLLPHIQTLVIRNNPKVLYDLADYIKGRYKINDNRWQLHELDMNMKIVIEKPVMALGVVKQITRYFRDILVDNQETKDYMCKYINEFREQFDKYGLEIDKLDGFILADDHLELGDRKLNIVRSGKKISRLSINQKLAPQQFICFHDIKKPVDIDEIVIKDSGNLCCVLQNAYYDGTNVGFFSLLRTAKELEIRTDQNEDNQVLVDLADYIEGKYALNANWKQEELDKDMRIEIYNCRYDYFLSITQRLKNYFKNISIDRIQTSLTTENVIDQECEDQYIFSNCRDANPQKFVVNAKLKGNGDLIKFNGTDSEVCIPEITIGEHGSFNAIVRNQWENYNGFKYGYYSLVSHVETLTIQNNPEAVYDLYRYVSGNYWIRSRDWKVQELRKNIVVRINGVKGLDEEVDILKEHFGYIFVDDRKVLGIQRREAIANIKLDGDKIQQQSTTNADRRSAVAWADAEIAETRRRIERAGARLGRRRSRFQEYLALAE